jgi:hypothetical protein
LAALLLAEQREEEAKKSPWSRFFAQEILENYFLFLLKKNFVIEDP